MMVPVVIMKIGLTLDCHKVGLGVLLQFGGVFGVKCGKGVVEVCGKDDGTGEK